MENDRVKALEVLKSGTTKQRVALYIADTDRMEHRKGNEHLMPLLYPEELQQLVHYDDAREKKMLDAQWDKYQIVSSALKDVERAFECLCKTSERMAYWQHSWALVEQMETAVNIALMQIQDPATRTATATGLAKNMHILGYCQSVDTDGCLVISPKDLMEDYDAESKMNDVAADLVNIIRDFKAALEAMREAIKKYGLTLPATGAYLRYIEREAATYDLWEKYSINRDGEPTLCGISGMQDLYKPYSLMPAYKEIQANQETKQMFLKYYLHITE